MTSIPIDRVVAESHRALKMGDTVRAMGLIRELSRQASHDPRTRLLQGMSALMFGQAEQAVRLLEQVAFELPEDDQRKAGIHLARARMAGGDAAGALATIEPFASADGASGFVVATKAEALVAAGRPDEADSLLNGFAKDDSDAHHLAIARARLAFATPVNDASLPARESAAIAALEAHHERVGVPGAVLSELLLCLGELLARRGEDIRAAHLFKRSAGLNPVRADVRPYAQTIASMLQSWNATTLGRAPRVKTGPASESERPLFVVGMPGGGAELAARLLALSPAAGLCGDADALGGAIMKGRAGSSDGAQPVVIDPSKLTGKQLETAAEAYLGRTDPGDAGVTRVIDANPLNLHELGVAAMMLPRARVVVVRRAAFDACFGCLLRHRNPRLLFAHDPRTLAVFAGGMRRLEEHWLGLFRSDRLSLAAHEVDYADLLAGGEAVGSLFAFAGLNAPGEDEIRGVLADHTRWTANGTGLDTRFTQGMPELASAVAQSDIGRA